MKTILKYLFRKVSFAGMKNCFARNIFNIYGLYLLIAVLLLLQGCASDQDKFNILKEYGLPDVKGASYVHLKSFSSRRNFPCSDFGYTPIFFGNAWFKNENTKGEGSFIINGCERTSLFKETTLDKFRDKSDARQYNYGSGAYDQQDIGEWTEVDLKTDLSDLKMEQLIRNIFCSASLNENIKSRQIARILLFAANIADAGYTEESHSIMQILELKEKSTLTRSSYNKKMLCPLSSMS